MLCFVKGVYLLSKLEPVFSSDPIMFYLLFFIRLTDWLLIYLILKSLFEMDFLVVLGVF